MSPRSSLATTPLPTRETETTTGQPQLVKSTQRVTHEELVAKYPYFDNLSSSAQRALVGRMRGAGAAVAAQPAVKPAPSADVLAMPLAMPLPANIRVNDPNEDIGAGNQTTQSEPSIAVKGRHIVVGFNDSKTAPNNYTGFCVSGNHGGSFQDRGALPGVQFGDNVLCVDHEGIFYYATLSVDGAGNSSIGVAKSTDHGVTFSMPVNASTTDNSPFAFQDKEWLVVDDDDDRNGNLYLAWTLFSGANAQIRFARSTDGGNTWSAPIALSTNGPSLGHSGAMPAIGPDGEIYVTWIDRNASQILITRSDDGGLTFANPVTGNGPVQNIVQIPPIMNGNIRANSFPSIAVDQDEGHVYITYAAQVGPDQGDVFLTVSRDGGKTWSAPVRANDDTTQNDQWMPSVAVTEDGIVGVMFYDRRNDPLNLNIDVYLAISTNHGKSFHPNQRITTTSFPPAVNFDPMIAPDYMGDYNQMVAAEERFYMVWGDNRDLVGARHDPNVYFASFHVDD